MSCSISILVKYLVLSRNEGMHPYGAKRKAGIHLLTDRIGLSEVGHFGFGSPLLGSDAGSLVFFCCKKPLVLRTDLGDH